MLLQSGGLRRLLSGSAIKAALSHCHVVVVGKASATDLELALWPASFSTSFVSVRLQYCRAAAIVTGAHVRHNLASRQIIRTD